ncbi:dihydrolipoamide acetyltransferase family protein [Thermoflavimicrobium dichotomicum]|uniref:Dihydrolipoamide acetyltransferase component of pyruvate dehydrogenase complex n=1 Tax=Thermoflavimicrobium dichotomicum TaxID=46223 RepID=A0A1I3RAC4_9BACL|nr:dihydrolipoamide acetyltransferase family protein [Thermoflavimicrobium dichotomicum]SFJ43553.1 pyruvate dehydrogenase E2 component (dihydrolipoamide acetyltransferase) [Thermoflavimicrobium dichotomicum]
MASEVIMPKLGMGMKEGTVVEWKKNAGDPVKKGDIVVVISSEKIEMEVEAPADGVLMDIVAPNGEVVPVGTVIGYIGEPGEKVGTEKKSETSSIANEQVAATAESVQSVTTPIPPTKKRKVKITPVARKMAEAAGLDINTLVGTGPQGRITKKDVEKAIADRERLSAASIQGKSLATRESAVADYAQEIVKDSIPTERKVVSGMRKVIATRMYESLQQSAQLSLTMTTDVSDLLQLQKQTAENVYNRYELKLTITHFIARAVVCALQQHKQMNSAWIDGSIYTYPYVHLGIAVALENGLVVPVIRHAERLTLVELAKEIQSLGLRARSGQLSPEDMKGSTFTISNLGAYGVEVFTPVLNPPEAGILGVGAVQDAPVYIGESLQRRSLLPLSLTFDHRVLDGAPAAQFLATVKRYLEQPYSLLF